MQQYHILRSPSGGYIVPIEDGHSSDEWTTPLILPVDLIFILTAGVVQKAGGVKKRLPGKCSEMA